MDSDVADPPSRREGPFHVMSKPVGPACNIACEYCFYLDKAALYPDTDDFRMDESTLETYIQQYIEAQPGPVVQFAWQGGEPTLLGVDFFREVVALQERYAPDGIQVTNALQTNGTMLDDEWGAFLAEEDFLVGISIDGPRELHDRFRRTRTGESTFDRVMRGRSILEDHDVEHNILCVLNSLNAEYPLEVYRFFRELDVEWLQFIPLVEYAAGTDPTPHEGEPSDHPTDGGPAPGSTLDPPERRESPAWVRDRLENGPDDALLDELAARGRRAPITGRSVGPRQYGEFMRTVFEEWIRADLESISVRLFDQALSMAVTGRASLCVFAETCGEQLAMEHNGDVYACDHYVDPGFKLGNIHEEPLAALVDSEPQRAFGAYKREGRPTFCLECPVSEFCAGGCPKNRHLEAPDGEFGLNYLCAGYKRFFSSVQPYLSLIERAIDDGLPLAAVSDEIAIRDERSAAE